MKSFRNILFVSHGVLDEADALRQALRLVHRNDAKLTALVVCPTYPSALAQYRGKFFEFMKQELARTIETARLSVMPDRTDLAVSIHVVCESTPVVHLIQRVIRDEHDLVIKEADSGTNQEGFRAFDMELLRKCPCPVWLCRPNSKSPHETRVGVAIDPDSSEPAGRDLSIRLLTLARSLADSCSGELSVISCWDFEFEEYLRRSVWTSVPVETVRAVVAGAHREQRRTLNTLLDTAGMTRNHRVHLERGQPDAVIPKLVEQLDIDILVMGTVARTGIPGFFIGNTAENILDHIHCSLLALKPAGFISPVKVS